MHGVEGKLHRLGRAGAANRLDGIVGPAPTADLLDPSQRVLAPRVDQVGGAELARPLQLLIEDVDRDHPGRADQRGGLDGVEADPAAADDDHVRAGHDLGAVDDRASAGGDPTANQADDVERGVLADRNDADVGYHGVGGVGAKLEVLADLLIAAAKAGGAIVEQVTWLVAQVAEVRPTDDAVGAATARRDVGGQDVIANLDLGYAWPDRFDHAGTFVAEDDRCWDRH